MSGGDRGRTVWLIDAGYMWFARHSIQPDWKFDYRKLRERIERNGAITQAYYFNSTPNPPTDQQDSFHTMLKLARPAGPQFLVRLYDLKNVSINCESCNHQNHKQVQKGVDVGIATIGLKLAHQDQLDTLILSTGDGDFEDMVSHIRNTLNKRIELVVFHEGVSPDLQSYADDIHWIDDFQADISRALHGATCSECGEEIEVPFEPDPGRPVYCRAHMPTRR